MKRALIIFAIIVLVLGGAVGYFYWKWTNNPLIKFTQFREQYYDVVHEALWEDDSEDQILTLLTEIKKEPLVKGIVLESDPYADALDSHEVPQGHLLVLEWEGGDSQRVTFEIADGVSMSETVDPDQRLTWTIPADIDPALLEKIKTLIAE